MACEVSDEPYFGVGPWAKCVLDLWNLEGIGRASIDDGKRRGGAFYTWRGFGHPNIDDGTAPGGL